MTDHAICLEDRVAVVTGAASGIGFRAAEQLCRAGASVALLDVDETGGSRAEGILRTGGGRARFFYCDVTSAMDCQEVTRAVREHFGRIDILFNNAGVMKRQTVVELEEADWDHVLNVNLKGVYLMSRSVIPIMAEGGGGSIINAGSGWGLRGGPRAAAYCAAKAGVVNLTRAMAIDHGKEGIRVNCVCPGDTETQMLREEARELGEDEEIFLESCADRPIARIGQPADIANAVLYLASDLSSWVTGTHLLVDGGGLA